MNSLKEKVIKSVFDYHIIEVKFDENFIIAIFEGNIEAKMPLKWFPKLYNANSIDRLNFQIMGKGHAIYWESLDEDLLAEGFFSYTK